MYVYPECKNKSVTHFIIWNLQVMTRISIADMMYHKYRCASFFPLNFLIFHPCQVYFSFLKLQRKWAAQKVTERERALVLWCISSFLYEHRKFPISFHRNTLSSVVGRNFKCNISFILKLSHSHNYISYQERWDGNGIVKNVKNDCCLVGWCLRFDGVVKAHGSWRMNS